MQSFQGPPGQEDMPYLLTPGPVTTSRTVKLAMLADYGARDQEFAATLKFIRNELLALANCKSSHDCVLLQGPGTFAMESVVGSLCPTRRKKTLIISNGVNGDRATMMLEKLGRPSLKLSYRETTAVRAEDVTKELIEDKSISHVWFVHCESSSGMLNQLSDVAKAVKAQDRILIVDAMATFGGLPIDISALGIDILFSSVDACLEGTPGFSFVIARPELLQEAQGQSHSVALDLHMQWQALQTSGQFRFTPPTNTLIAFREALNELAAEGGVIKRNARYLNNAQVLRTRLKAMGFSLLLQDADASPIIQTVLSPRVVTFNFNRFYDELRSRGFAIVPGYLSKEPSFRVGCIGQVDEQVMINLCASMEDVLKLMDVRSLSPAPAAQ
jgi:2-aminoethylphosphonate-pyruvate transaminase